MAYTNYTAAQAKSRAEATTRFTTGRCLEFVMTCVNGERTGLYDANAAWAAAERKEYTGVPPAGAPVYFRGGPHGHIAISVGGGKVRSTDWRQGYGYDPSPAGEMAPVGTATINEVAIDFFGSTSAYRGWSRDYDGLLIRGLEETNTNYSPPPVVPEEDDMPLTNDDVAKVANAVWGKLYKSPTNGVNYSTGQYLIGTAARSSETFYNTDSLEASVAELRKAVAALTAKVDKLA